MIKGNVLFSHHYLFPTLHKRISPRRILALAARANLRTPNCLARNGLETEVREVEHAAALGCHSVGDTRGHIHRTHHEIGDALGRVPWPHGYDLDGLGHAGDSGIKGPQECVNVLVACGGCCRDRHRGRAPRPDHKVLDKLLKLGARLTLAHDIIVVHVPLRTRKQLECAAASDDTAGPINGVMNGFGIVFHGATED